nr:PREDICTED: uncharacterized protein LOC102697419 [Lepisosteus oculatus]
MLSPVRLFQIRKENSETQALVEESEDDLQRDIQIGRHQLPGTRQRGNWKVSRKTHRDPGYKAQPDIEKAGTPSTPSQEDESFPDAIQNGGLSGTLNPPFGTGARLDPISAGTGERDNERAAPGISEKTTRESSTVSSSANLCHVGRKEKDQPEALVNPYGSENGGISGMLWNPFRSVPKDRDDKDVTSGHLDKSSVKTASEESIFHSKQIGVNSGIPINPFYSWTKEKDSEDLAAESCEKINSEKTGRDESLFHSKQIGVNSEILWNPFYSWSKDNEVVTLESLGKMSSGKTSSAEKLSQTKQDGDVGEMVRNPFLSALKEMGRESVAPEPCETLRSEEPAGKGKRGSSDWLSGFQREVPSNPFYTSPKPQGQADLESWRDVQARKSLSDSALIAPEPAGPSLVLPRVLPAPVQERRWSRVETEAPLYESIILIGQVRAGLGWRWTRPLLVGFLD